MEITLAELIAHYLIVVGLFERGLLSVDEFRLRVGDILEADGYPPKSIELLVAQVILSAKKH